jgi:hypothetical protein
MPLRASVGSTEASNGRLARVGVIDRSIGEPSCARRCRRTNGTSLSVKFYHQTTYDSPLAAELRIIQICATEHLARNKGISIL